MVTVETVSQEVVSWVTSCQHNILLRTRKETFLSDTQIKKQGSTNITKPVLIKDYFKPVYLLT